MGGRKTENIMKQFGCSLLPLFLLAVLMAGCDTRTPTEVHFRPNGNGPLSSIKPATVLIQVEDQRPPAERDSVYQIVADIGGTQTFYTKKPVPLIVRDALGSELSKCGHRVVADPGATTDVRVKVVLKKFRVFLSTTLFNHSVEAQVDAEVLVTHGNATVPPFQISGDYLRKTTSNLLGASDAEESLSAALAEFVHNLTFDSRFVEGLQ
jgi:uncharacterized lipoprotein YajG